MNTVTRQQAEKRYCPKKLSNSDLAGVLANCDTVNCMAWQWKDYEKLETWTVINTANKHRAYEGMSEVENIAPDDFTEVMFGKPQGEGWKFIHFTQGEDGWEAYWQRTKDNEREGYCGLCRSASQKTKP